jgi:predicted AlkP superfamily phosphohydrolase/phosphomutase
MDDGVMPVLKRLVERGVHGHLLSTIPPVTFPAFTSIMTGRSPGYHSIFDFVRAEERNSQIYFAMNTSRDVRCETIWSIASRNRCRVICLNFPVTYPQRPLLGFGIPGFVSFRHLRQNIYPPEMYEKIRSLPGFSSRDLTMDLDLEKKTVQGLTQAESEEWIAVHERRERQLFQILEYLMANEPWELAAVVFDGVDKLQHVFWRFIDPTFYPDLPSAWEKKIRDRCRNYFAQLDSFLGRIVALAGPAARLFMVSDHGFGPTTEVFYINKWLQQRGYLQWGQGAPRDESGKLTVERLKSHVMLLDWEKTIAYAFTPSSNGIHIRVAQAPGRPGIRPEEYEAFRQQLRRELLEFTDPETGGQVVTQVLTREEAFPGSCMHLAPDLTLSLRDGGFVSILNSDVPLRSRPEVAGTHRPEGIFIALGTGIREGASLEPLSILDVAPTVLYSLGLPIPEDFEGQVPAEIFTPSFIKAQPVCMGEPTQPPELFPTAQTMPMTGAVEEVEILDRLKALGYVE